MLYNGKYVNKSINTSVEIKHMTFFLMCLSVSFRTNTMLFNVEVYT